MSLVLRQFLIAVMVMVPCLNVTGQESFDQNDVDRVIKLRSSSQSTPTTPRMAKKPKPIANKAKAVSPASQLPDPSKIQFEAIVAPNATPGTKAATEPTSPTQDAAQPVAPKALQRAPIVDQGLNATPVRQVSTTNPPTHNPNPNRSIRMAEASNMASNRDAHSGAKGSQLGTDHSVPDSTAKRQSTDGSTSRLGCDIARTRSAFKNQSKTDSR